jgi:hypothetical protein
MQTGTKRELPHERPPHAKFTPCLGRHNRHNGHFGFFVVIDVVGFFGFLSRSGIVSGNRKCILEHENRKEAGIDRTLPWRARAQKKKPPPQTQRNKDTQFIGAGRQSGG